MSDNYSSFALFLPGLWRVPDKYFIVGDGDDKFRIKLTPIELQQRKADRFVSTVQTHDRVHGFERFQTEYSYQSGLFTDHKLFQSMFNLFFWKYIQINGEKKKLITLVFSSLFQHMLMPGDWSINFALIFESTVSQRRQKLSALMAKISPPWWSNEIE